MPSFLPELIGLGVFVLLLALGYGFGTWAEKRHYKSIQAREKILNALPAIASKHIPPKTRYQQKLVLGNVVLSVDYFKRFLAKLHNFFGGRVTSYETLVDRARREAMLRMKEMAQEAGAEMIFNVKYETASMSQGQQDGIGSIEVLAYGTALIPRTTSPEPKA